MNDTTIPKPYWPSIMRVVVVMIAVLACLVLTVCLILPSLATRYLPVNAIKGMGVADFQGRVSSIGWYRATAGPFVLGHPERPAVTIGSVAVDYAPRELYRKRIRRLQISDVTINGTVGAGGIRLPGVDPIRGDAETPTVRANPGGWTPPMGLAVGRIEIRSARAILEWRQVTRRIPFDADLVPEGSDPARWKAQVRLYPGDQRMLLNVNLDLNERVGELRLDGHDLALDALAGLFRPAPGLDVSGKMALLAKATIGLAPFDLSDISIDLSWHEGRLSYGAASLAPLSRSAAASFSAASPDLEKWQIKAGGLRLQTLVPASVHTLDASLDLGQDTQTAESRIDLELLPFTMQCPRPVALEKALALPLKLSLTRHAAGDWRVEGGIIKANSNQPSKGPHAVIAGAQFRAGSPQATLTAAGRQLTGEILYQADLPHVQATAAGTTVTGPKATIGGALRFDLQPDTPLWSGQARAQLPALRLQGFGATGRLEALILSAQFEGQGDAPPMVAGQLQFVNGRFQHDGSGMRLAGIRLDLPYRSNPKQADAGGTFSIARIAHRQRDLGDIQGRIDQQEDGYTIAATHASRLFPNLNAEVSGRVGDGGWQSSPATVTVDIPAYTVPDDSDLGRWLPAAQGASLSGTVSARATASILDNRLHAELDLTLQDGLVRIPERKMVVAGIDTRLHFPELPRIRSAPAQSLRFDRAAMGAIVVDGGQFDFQLESPDTLLVEKGRLRWCGGKVDTQALRITAGKRDYQVSLYCQRLGLSQILEQLGSVHARGTGTVNGRIPVSFSNGKIRFDDGFLFSTPGEGGQIRLTGTEVLTRGIPSGTPQFVQVELARAALEDYAYEWVKLGLESQAEDMVMRLQFDGKPAKPLPFRYQKEIGSFVRVETGQQGSLFQGISLDVNLRLPLNRLLQYKDIVNMID